ncbi:hypothetical protein LEP1GSC192_1131 [Leptospira sp. B5-022]|nr:hypothetical protein LEP1GSC192_1131 [Leptospira sp. B5-022]
MKDRWPHSDIWSPVYSSLETCIENCIRFFLKKTKNRKADPFNAELPDINHFMSRLKYCGKIRFIIFIKVFTTKKRKNQNNGYMLFPKS